MENVYDLEEFICHYKLYKNTCGLVTLYGKFMIEQTDSNPGVWHWKPVSVHQPIKIHAVYWHHDTMLMVLGGLVSEALLHISGSK